MSGLGLELEVVAGPDAAAKRAAELIEESAREALGQSSFSIALSGGHTPWKMLAELDPDTLGEPGTTIFQVDERVAPEGDPDRNLTHLHESLSETAQQRLLPMPVNDDDLAEAAERYANALPDAIDLVHLGLGDDGHTASLVPGDPVLEVSDRAVAVTGGEYQGHPRMTLTYPTLEAAKKILFLVTGAGKRDALAKLRAGDDSIPAGPLARQAGVIVADEAAAGET